MISVKLRISGFEVVAAPDGQQALDIIKNELPDAILLDVIMPGVDGFEVLKKLRPTSKIPVIAISAQPEYAQQALDLGANYFMPKPFDVDEIVENFKKLLRY